MKKLMILLLLACTALPALAQVNTLLYKNEKRRYIVYVPEAYGKEPDQRYPVVFHFHGGGMSMAEQMLYTQMNRAADRHRFIVVYPAGLKQDWNVGFGMPYLEGSDDIGFTEALLARLRQDYRVDAARVYATGLSRGGFFALRIGAELPHLFAAVAAVGAPMPEPVVKYHTATGKVGVLLMHGTADQVVAYQGKPGAYLSALDSYRYWSGKNGIAASAPVQVLGAGVTRIEAGNGQQSVALVTVTDGGHTWPGADPFNVGLPIGLTSRAFDANEVIWQFLAQHRR
jgi:polyhydroxybutyrate depolymerase